VPGCPLRPFGPPPPPGEETVPSATATTPDDYSTAEANSARGLRTVRSNVTWPNRG